MSWIDPVQIAVCGRRLVNDREAALSRRSLVIGSAELSDGSEAAFDQLSVWDAWKVTHTGSNQKF
jgi:hypothetical protein